MRRPYGVLFVVCISLFAGGLLARPASAQALEPPPRPLRPGEREDPEAKTLQQMVAKQQISRRKKEHEEMIKKGENALKISEELESSIEAKNDLSTQDIEKLQELEKLVIQIRKDLGAKDSDDDDQISADREENSAFKSFGAAFKFLKSSTIKLVDELKRSTRFSISVAAIQASNSVVKFARFLRLKQ